MKKHTGYNLLSLLFIYCGARLLGSLIVLTNDKWISIVISAIFIAAYGACKEAGGYHKAKDK
jgi:hypothetical protein